MSVGERLPMGGLSAVHRQPQLTQTISLRQAHSGKRMACLGGTGIPGHGTRLTARILGTAVLEDLPSLVLGLEIAGLRSLEHIASATGLVLRADPTLEKHMSVERKRAGVTGIGAALEEMHGQALGTRRAWQPARVKQLFCKTVFEPGEQ